MVRSTARFISYDLRPAKQSERRIILDLLKIAGDCGLPIQSYRYVGMGANRFYDFILIHKYIGIQNMVSIEHDKSMYERAVFNCPYGFIDIVNSTVDQFITRDAFDVPSILWFDYDGGIGQSIIRDISSLSTKLKVGDMCFITVSGAPPRVLDRENNEAKLTWFQDELGDVSGDVLIGDVERSAFPTAVHKVLMAAFRNAFSIRRDGAFVPLLQVLYSDSMPMITVGGGLLAQGQAFGFLSKLASGLPFLTPQEKALYVIKSLHLTERERVLFDRAATKRNRKSSEHNQLKKLGFGDSEISAYKDLIRYLPRYVETII